MIRKCASNPILPSGPFLESAELALWDQPNVELQRQRVRSSDLTD